MDNPQNRIEPTFSSPWSDDQRKEFSRRKRKLINALVTAGHTKQVDGVSTSYIINGQRLPLAAIAEQYDMQMGIAVTISQTVSAMQFMLDKANNYE